jgi:tetratricopeptide (TPR) repeat protein
VARRGPAVIAETMAEKVGGGKLVSVVQNAPAPAVLYSLDPFEGNAGPLMPKPRLARALKAWQNSIEATDYFPGVDRLPSDPAEKLARMVALLDDHPELWQSFEVLADLAYAARGLDILGIDDNVILPLLERAEVLIDAVLSESGAEGCCLEWGFWENRPALDLLAWRIGMDLDKPATPDHLRRLERLLALNPNDNQAMRMPLSRRYLEDERFDDAVELAERYPDDFPEMQYNHALALYALGQHEQAGHVMAAAAKDYPKILEALLKPRIRRPTINPSAVSLGGDDEAWLYRESYRPIWQRLDALGWAKRFLIT